MGYTVEANNNNKKKQENKEFLDHLLVQELPLWNESSFCSIPPVGQLKWWIQKCNSELLQKQPDQIAPC